MFPAIDSSGNTERGGTCTILLSVSVQGTDLAFGTDSQAHVLGSFRPVSSKYISEFRRWRDAYAVQSTTAQCTEPRVREVSHN
jgi:hypothetical protein